MTKFQGNKLEDVEESEGLQDPNGDTRRGGPGRTQWERLEAEGWDPRGRRTH